MTAASSATPTVVVAAAASPAPSLSGDVGDAEEAPAEDGRGLARRDASTILLRITELLPDPIEPGPDAEFEWVELANVGETPASLAGLLLNDNRDQIVLPELTLPPGGTLVVAGLRAEIGDALAIREPAGLFNGLGNDGDRVALTTIEGEVVDALSYGNDDRFDRPPLQAPAPGRSLQRRFASDGRLTAIAVAPKPSPGRLEDSAVAIGAPPAATAADVAVTAPSGASEAPPEHIEDPGGANRVAWIVLGMLAAGALLGAAAYRARDILR